MSDLPKETLANPFNIKGTMEENIGQKSELFSQSWEILNLPLEAKNAFEHYAMLKDQEQPAPMSDDAGEKMGPAIIIGSGESLDRALPFLKDWKGAIFCSSSHISTLAYHGIVPTYICTPDPRCAMGEFENIPEEYWEKAWGPDGCTFLQTPIGPWQYTKFWKGRVRWFQIMDPGKQWYTQILTQVFPWIKDYLLPFTANVPALVAQAMFLGYSALYLVGVDFANKRFNAMNYIDGEWQKSEGGFQNEESFVQAHNGQVSTPNLLWSKRGLLCVLRLNAEFAHGKKWNAYLCSNTSALEELPYADIKKVVKNQGKGMRYPWTKKRYLDTLDVGLARYQTVVLPFNNGMASGNRIHFAYSQESLGQQIDGLNAALEGTLKEYEQLPPDLKKEAESKGFSRDSITMLDKKKLMEHYEWARKKATKS